MSLELIIQKIEKARLKVSKHHIVKLVGVSKYTDSEQILKVYQEGQRAFAESKVQDLQTKTMQLSNYPIEWHFIGNLQKNKINKLIELDPFLMHSLNSYELSVELQKRLKQKNRTINALLQINSAKEQSKSGFLPQEAIEQYLKIQEECKNINLLGVMSIGANTKETKQIQNSFELTYKIYEKLNQYGAKICSMGMSSDFELAILCGSNMVRVGSALFNLATSQEGKS